MLGLVSLFFKTDPSVVHLSSKRQSLKSETERSCSSIDKEGISNSLAEQRLGQYTHTAGEYYCSPSLKLILSNH
jgi:hypothetical protein